MNLMTVITYDDQWKAVRGYSNIAQVNVSFDEDRAILTESDFGIRKGDRRK